MIPNTIENSKGRGTSILKPATDSTHTTILKIEGDAVHHPAKQLPVSLALD